MKVLAVATLSLLSFASVASFAAETKLDGWISDSMCGAKHAGTGAACAKKCVDGGSSPVFVDSAKKEVWAIDNPGAVKDSVGKHVKLTVTVDPSAKSVHVTQVAVLAD